MVGDPDLDSVARIGIAEGQEGWLGVGQKQRGKGLGRGGSGRSPNKPMMQEQNTQVGGSHERKWEMTEAKPPRASKATLKIGVLAQGWWEATEGFCAGGWCELRDAKWHQGGGG